jgi:hypothetical protein
MAHEALSIFWMEQRRRILIADDDLVILKTVGGFLRRHGYEVNLTWRLSISEWNRRAQASAPSSTDTP